MKVNREKLYKKLTQVAPGLASKEVLEQSGCFIFKQGHIITFNDEVTVKTAFDIGVECAIPSQKFLNLLGKMGDDEIDISLKDDSVLVIKGNRKKAQIAVEQEVSLPVELVDYPEKFKTKISEEFIEILKKATITCSKDLTRPILNCVHVHDGFAQSCDNFRACRFEIDSIKQELLIPASIIGNLQNYEVVRLGMTDCWVHFKCKGGVIFSFRRLKEDFPNLVEAGLFKTKGIAFTIPKQLHPCLDRAGIFSQSDFTQDNIVTLEMEYKRIKVKATGEGCSYEETISCKIPKLKQQDPLSFEIHPEFLRECSADMKVTITERTLSMKTDTFQYAAILSLQ